MARLPVRHPLGALDGGLTGGCFGNSSILGGHSSKTDSYHYDVNIYDLTEVEWAIVSRCDPATQVHVLPSARTHQNNPIAGVKEIFGEPIVKGKLIIDATIPWKARQVQKGEGMTFFTRSEWPGVDLADYFEPKDRDRFLRRG